MFPKISQIYQQRCSKTCSRTWIDFNQRAGLFSRKNNTNSRLYSTVSSHPCTIIANNSRQRATTTTSSAIRYRINFHIRNNSYFHNNGKLIYNNINSKLSKNTRITKIHKISKRNLTGAELIAIATSSKVILSVLATMLGISGVYWYLSEEEYIYDPLAPLDFDRIREEIRNIMYDPQFDDGCCAPLLLRLAFNQAATYSKYDLLGGTNGATIRFEPERSFYHNRGLDSAMLILEKIKKKFPKISYSDLWVLASYVAIEEMGGPKMEFKYGRTDAVDGLECVEGSRFPNFEDGASVLLDWFDRMNLTDREGVALMGAHSCGRLHSNICGLDGSWTDAQILSTDYYKNLKFVPYLVERRGVEHYFDPANPDMVLLTIEGAFFYCARLMKWSEYYAFVDPFVWLNDFATVYKKITEHGCQNLMDTKKNINDNIYDHTIASQSITSNTNNNNNNSNNNTLSNNLPNEDLNNTTPATTS